MILPPILEALLWAGARNASTESRLIAVVLAGTTAPDQPPACWTIGALADITRLHPASAAEAIRWLHRHGAIRVCRRANGERLVFANIEAMATPQTPSPAAAPDAPAPPLARPRGRPRKAAAP